ncbi:MAG: chorismate mutase [Rhodospirillales bacterium]
MDNGKENLDALRREIDRIDESMHDLVMRRADVAKRLRTAKDGAPTFRPEREAKVLRRLAARHRGALPLSVMVRIWREMIGANLCLQGPFTVAVAHRPDQPGVWDLARDHYGSHAIGMTTGSPAQVLSAVAEGGAMIGVLGLPRDDEAEPWWPTLAASSRGPRVVARLPFAGPGNARGERPQALAVALLEPEPTGQDRALVAVEARDEFSRTRLAELLARAGLGASVLAVAKRGSGDGAGQLSLVEVNQFLKPGEQRLAALDAAAPGEIARMTVIGAYAEPLAVPEANAR